MLERPNQLSYKPSGFYFRRALRESNDPARLREIGHTLVLEVEHLRSYIRGLGLVPPKLNVMESEAVDKGWQHEHCD